MAVGIGGASARRAWGRAVRTCLGLSAVMALFLTVSFQPVAVSAQPSSPPGSPVAWQSAGDSYSSGEGVYSNVGPCAQSQLAYGPLAAKAVQDVLRWDLGSETFTACTGRLVEDYFNDVSGKGSLWQWGRQQGGPDRVDVIVLSFGGNDIGFADVLRDCLDLPSSWRDLGELVWSGCDVSQEELMARIDGLLDPSMEGCSGLRQTDDAGYGCDLDIGDRRGSIIDFYYDIVTHRLTPRGQLYVVGYPRLFAPTDQWPGWNKPYCDGVGRGDTQKLGRVAQHFNTKLFEAVDRVNQALGTRRVHYVDLVKLYSQGGHELCGTGQDWLNGIASNRDNTNDRRWRTSFHPNANGHEGVAVRLVEKVEATFPKGAALNECTKESIATAVGYSLTEVLSEPTCADDWAWIDACPAAERDPEVGCLHVGKILQLVDGRWAVMGALLQDCAESFTALGAPLETASRFYPSCFSSEGSEALVDCRAAATSVRSQPSPEMMTRCLYLAWRAGDRDVAEAFAEPPAVDAMFSLVPGIEWEFNGCYRDPSRAGGDGGSWLGQFCSYTEPAPGEVHGVMIEFSFIAYDDIAVIADVQFLG